MVSPAEYLTFLSFRKLTLDPELQMRDKMDQAAVLEYMENYRTGVEMPAIKVFSDGSKYYPVDGWHRIKAARSVDLKGLNAEIIEGTYRDALLYACGANGKHGVRRTDADKWRAAKKLLVDAEWGAWSDAEISRRCRVDHKFIATVRAAIREAGKEAEIAKLQETARKLKEEKEARKSAAAEAHHGISHDAPTPPETRTCQRGEVVYQQHVKGGDGASQSVPGFGPPPAPAKTSPVYDVTLEMRIPTGNALAKLAKEAAAIGHSADVVEAWRAEGERLLRREKTKRRGRLGAGRR